MAKKHNPKTTTDMQAQPVSLDLEARVKLCSQPLAYGSAQLVAFAELVIGLC